MKKGDAVRVHEIVRVTAGADKGMVGTVVAIGPDWAEVFFEGVLEHEPYREQKRIKFASLGRNHG